jgi:hypothetical protein
MAAAGGIALTSGPVSAMPNGLSHAISQVSKINEARYVCNASRQCGTTAHMPSVEIAASTPLFGDTAAGIKATPRTSTT